MNKPLIVVAAAFAFATHVAVAQSQALPLTDQQKVVQAENSFGFSMLNSLTAKDPAGNVFISPTSIHLALSMLTDGAGGTTRSQVAKTLGVNDLSQAQLDAANAGVMQTLTAFDGTASTVQIANSLWGRDGVTFEPVFLAAASNSYGAQISSLDFNSPTAPDRINQWASDHTNGKIKSIVGKIDPNTILFLVNAVYFKDQWAKQFAKAATKPGTFTTGAGGSETAQMMSRYGDMPYAETDDYQAVSLPFLSGYEMVIVLPKGGVSVGQLAAHADSESWNALRNSLSSRKGNLTLPRTSIDFSTSLNDSLKALGMPNAFDPNIADFSLMTKGVDRPYVSNVLHKTYLDIDEDGAEAAAVTAIEMGAMSMRVDPNPPFTMNVDHPFLCAIVHQSTGAVLFVGEVNDPVKK